MDTIRETVAAVALGLLDAMLWRLRRWELDGALGTPHATHLGCKGLLVAPSPSGFEGPREIGR